MRKLILTSIFAFCAVFANQVSAKSDDYKTFESLFSKWTASFDKKDLSATCHLFSPSIVANYQGYPVKHFQSLCDLFKKTFSEKREYKYTFRIRRVIRENDLAVVRVTWFLRVSEHGKLISDARDEGMDVFRKNKQGEWQIVSYLGYPVKK